MSAGEAGDWAESLRRSVSVTLDPNGKVNFSSAVVLLVEQSPFSIDVLSQIFKGFGARNLHRATSIAEAKEAITRFTIDVMVIDPNLMDGDGHEFIKWLRRDGGDINRTVPILVVSANSSNTAIARARNSGASFYMVKPLTPANILQRIMWVVRDKRQFYDGETYAGPDRRFRIDGPPPENMPPRRSGDGGAQAKAEAPNAEEVAEANPERAA
jgi:CheY-like chemotaxis protein